MAVGFVKAVATVSCVAGAALLGVSCGADIKSAPPSGVASNSEVSLTETVPANDPSPMIESCNEKSEIDSCRKSCEADESKACESLGSLLYRVCRSSKVPEDCEPYLAAITHDDNADKEIPPEGRREHFKFACEKDLADCRTYITGGMHHHRDDDLGFDLYSVGCLSARLHETIDTAAAGACDRYGQALWAGSHGLKADKKSAIRYRAENCGDTEVNSDACIFVGNCFESGEYVQQSDDQALRYWARGCSGYVGEDACDFLADRFDAGTLTTSMQPEVESELQKGCDAKGGGNLPRAPEACVILGEMKSAKDPKAAKALFDRAAVALDHACNGEYPEMLTCALLAHMKRSGLGMPVDTKGAAQLYKRACDSGVARGCYGLGMLTRFGNGAIKDEGAAAALLKKACDRGYEAACKQLGE